MGCGDSKGLPIYASVPCSVSEAATDSKLGSLVHVIGFIRPSETLIRAPFSEDACVACADTTFQPKETPPVEPFSHKMFSARACVPFQIVDGSAAILVDASVCVNDDVDAKPVWDVKPMKQHEVFDLMNTAADVTPPTLAGHVGGGVGHFSQSAPMVDALAFWAVLNGGKDAPNHMKQMGSPSATQKARSAKEGTLKPGDRVAVVGTLSKRDDGAFVLTASAEQHGAITNSPHLNPKLKVKQGQYAPDAPSDAPDVPLVSVASLRH